MNPSAVIILFLGLLALSVSGQRATNQTTSASCKDPTVVHRRLSDDVRYASPFYVIALPRNNKTETIDNVCYTYFETEKGHFFHIMSVVYKNGNNSYFTFSKGDISNRLGLAEATAEKTSPCLYHDYTLTPICNNTVFILYRCFLHGECEDIDIGITAGVDVRVTLAATPHVSAECRQETEASLRDTTSLAGGDYVILPQVHKPQCVTHYLGKSCINEKNALGSIMISAEDAALRFSENSHELEFTGTTSTATVDHTTQRAGTVNTKDESGGIVFSGTTISSKPITPEVETTTTVKSTAQDTTSTTPITPPRRTYADVVKSSKTRPQVKGSVKA